MASNHFGKQEANHIGPGEETSQLIATYNELEILRERESKDGQHALKRIVRVINATGISVSASIDDR